MTGLPRLVLGARTHIGSVRRENQDRMGHFVCPFGEVFIVADGMGGHKGGSQAATMVVEGFQRHLCQAPAHQPLRAALRAAAHEVNTQVCEAATSGDPATDHMGSTAVLLVVSGCRALIGHLGDSRAYLWRRGRLLRLTRDHTWVQQLVDQHLLSEEEARNHPEASVLAQAFGRRSDFDIELSPAIGVRAGDAVLLCSDGLSGYVDDDEIATVLGRQADPQRTADALIDAALIAGGHDNITVQLVVFSTRPRRCARRRMSRDGKLIHPRRHAPRPMAPAPAVPPGEVSGPAPEPPQPAVSTADTLPPELVPTLPVLPLEPMREPLPERRRKRVAGGLVVTLTLVSAAGLVVGLRRWLQPVPSPGTPAPRVAPVVTPATPTATPTSKPDELRLPAPAGQTPTPAAQPSPPEGDGGRRGARP